MHAMWVHQVCLHPATLLVPPRDPTASTNSSQFVLGVEAVEAILNCYDGVSEGKRSARASTSCCITAVWECALTTLFHVNHSCRSRDNHFCRSDICSM